MASLSPKLLFQIPSHWSLGLLHKNFRETQTLSPQEISRRIRHNSYTERNWSHRHVCLCVWVWERQNMRGRFRGSGAVGKWCWGMAEGSQVSFFFFSLILSSIQSTTEKLVLLYTLAFLYPCPSLTGPSYCIFSLHLLFPIEGPQRSWKKQSHCSRSAGLVSPGPRDPPPLSACPGDSHLLGGKQAPSSAYGLLSSIKAWLMCMETAGANQERKEREKWNRDWGRKRRTC